MAEIRWININIGCIETPLMPLIQQRFYAININIGCIETNLSAEYIKLPDR